MRNPIRECAGRRERLTPKCRWPREVEGRKTGEERLRSGRWLAIHDELNPCFYLVEGSSDPRYVQRP